MNGAEYLVGTLKARGVEQVFVLCGNGLNPFLDACMDFGVRIIDVRNEQAASHMADCFGRLTGRLGVVAVSAGPGHMNALPGLANSHSDGGPMLLISGCSEAGTRGAGHFQELPQVELVSPICKHARLVERPDQLPQQVHTAISEAISGRPGPVHLTITADVMGGPVDAEPDESAPPADVNPVAAGDPALIRHATQRLAEAERPVIVAGSGAFYARAGDALRILAALTDIPIFTPIWDRCCVDQAWPQYLGVTSSEVNGAFPLVAEADVIMTVGARADYRLNSGRPPTVGPDVEFIRIDIDPAEVDRTVRADLGIVGDPRSVLQKMVEDTRELDAAPHSGWLDRHSRAREAFVARWDDYGHEEELPVRSLRLMREIKPFLANDVTFLLDGGNIGRWAHMILWDRHPTFWHTCGASGLVGWGLSGAIAAKLARPDHPVLLLSGDGSAGFTVSEIETALRFETPYVAVVAHDSAWGIVAEDFPEDRRHGSALGEIRFDRVAEAFGARGVCIEAPDQIAPAIEEGLALDTVTFIHVPVQLGGIEYMAREWGVDEPLAAGG